MSLISCADPYFYIVSYGSYNSACQNFIVKQNLYFSSTCTENIYSISRIHDLEIVPFPNHETH